MADFDLVAMQRAMLQCDKNIKVFEVAIQKELDTKKEYAEIIRVLIERATQPKEKNSAKE
jgi:hypothetical protein